MIAVMDDAPKFCPGCGKTLRLDEPFSRGDWDAGASQGCDCGWHFQRANRSDILAAAEKAGDMAYYAKRGQL
jgi:hypothetical protein